MEPVPLEDRENEPFLADVISYTELEPGDRFIFLYPHHGEQPWAWLYIRETDGHHRIDEDNLLPPLGTHVPLRVKKISTGVSHENGLIFLQALE